MQRLIGAAYRQVMKIIAILAVLFVAACAPIEWTPNGPSAARDDYDCKRDAMQTMHGISTVRAFYIDCMEAKGYRRAS